MVPAPNRSRHRVAASGVEYSSILSCIAALADHAKATAFWGRGERVAPFPIFKFDAGKQCFWAGPQMAQADAAETASGFRQQWSLGSATITGSYSIPSFAD
jgi:hypothetical protein